MSGKSYAVFDIDGTLIRWQLYHALADSLVKARVIDKQAYTTVLQARYNWKTRRSSNSFADYEQSLVRLIDRSLPGLDYQVFSDTCAFVFDRYQDQVYTFTRDLIAELRQRQYLIFALSASPSELVSLVANYYQFDDYGASSYEVKDAKLTGAKQLLFGPAKRTKLKQLISEHGASEQGSIALGDSDGDIAMLELADRAIAFNPSRELLNVALAKHWEVVIERKNVVYRLEYRHGQYLLAPTDGRPTIV